MTTKLSVILGSSEGGSGSMNVITENRDPMASDTASIGWLWINETTNRYFICTDNTLGNCVWEAGAGGEAVVADTRDPNSSDLGNLGNLWINTLSNKFFICTDDTPGATVWATDTQIDVIVDTVNPTVANSGHAIGTLWINSTNSRLFFCVDNTSGAAKWRSTVEVLDKLIDPTQNDWDYPLGTMWINAAISNKKTYFVLISNEENKAIWSKNETDVYWVTDPTITGSVVAECDESLYSYNADGSLSSLDEASSLEYHWSCTGGVLSATTGNNVNLYFTNAEKDSIQILSCYAQDDLGYISKTIEFPITVRVVNPVSGLSLSLPNKIYTGESAFFDVTVGYTGGDHSLNYYWESSDDGINWTSVFFSDPNIKLADAVMTTTGLKQVRCTVTNLGGSVTITSSSIPCIDIVTDSDSTYLDTDLHLLENKEYPGLMINANKVSVPTVIFELSDRIIVNGEQDDLSDVTNVFDTKMNIITDKTLLNDDYSSFTTSCTLMGNKVIVGYVDSNVSGKGVLKVGTFNGDTISYGDPVTFNNDYSQWINLLPLTDNKVIVAYRDDGNNNLGGCRIGTVEGDTINFSAEFVFNSVDTDHISLCKIDDNRFAIAYSDYGTGNLGTLVVGEVSGNTISFGTQQVYTNSAYFNSMALVDTDKLVICYQDDTNSNYGTALIAGVTGTTLVLGSPIVFSGNGYTNYIKVHTVETNKIVITYQDVGASGYGYGIVGDITGTNIVFGTAAQFSTTNATYISSRYAEDRLYIAYKNGDTKGVVNFGEITGNTLTFKIPIIFNNGTTDYITIFELDNKAIIVFKDGSDADQGKMMVFTPYMQELTFATQTITTDEVITRLNRSYVLPIIGQQPAQEVFEKVEMRVQTNRNNVFNVTEDAGKIVYENYEISPYIVGDRLLVTGNEEVYTVISQIDRSVVTGNGEVVKGNEDVFNTANTQQTATTILKENFDEFVVSAFRDNSSSGSIVLGELKYDNIYFGSKLTFVNNDVDYVKIAKIADNKAIVCFQDLNDNTGKAFIVKIENGELTIGGVYQFEAGTTEYIDVAMVSLNKFVISYQDVSDFNKGKCILGDVTNLSISFGSAIEFSSGNTTYTSVTAVSSTKIAIAYRDIDNSGYGTVKVGNIIGMDVTFGSAQIFYNGSVTFNGIELLSSNKIVIKYTDYTNSNYGAVIVGIVSGTSVSFGISAYFNQNETYYSDVIVTDDDIFMIVYDNYIGTKGYGIVCTVSAQDIILGDHVEINNGTTSHISVAKSNYRKVVATYSDQANNYYGTAQIVRRDIDKIRSEIQVVDTLPTSMTTIELLPYRIEASIGDIQSFESTEYFHTDLDEVYSVLNANTLLTTATITTSGNYFYSRVLTENTDEFDKTITRIDVDFWTQP